MSVITPLPPLQINHLRSIKTKWLPFSLSYWPFGYSFTSRGNGPHTYLMFAPLHLLLNSCGGWKFVAHQDPKRFPSVLLTLVEVLFNPFV